MTYEEIISVYESNGAQLLIDQTELKERLRQVDTFIFDWDGIFNDGRKGSSGTSSFSEPDSMGTNLMRFSYYLNNGDIPRIGIMTGASNSVAYKFAEREHFNFIVRGITNKKTALELLLNEFDINPSRTLFVFDDLLDLPVADWAGTRIQVSRPVQLSLNEFIIKSGYVDYVTANAGDQNAVREISELYLSAMENAEESYRQRILHTEIYEKYLQLRNSNEIEEISSI